MENASDSFDPFSWNYSIFPEVEEEREEFPLWEEGAPPFQGKPDESLEVTGTDGWDAIGDQLEQLFEKHGSQHNSSSRHEDKRVPKKPSGSAVVREYSISAPKRLSGKSSKSKSKKSKADSKIARKGKDSKGQGRPKTSVKLVVVDDQGESPAHKEGEQPMGAHLESMEEKSTMGNDAKREGENSERALVVVVDDPGPCLAHRKTSVQVVVVDDPGESLVHKEGEQPDEEGQLLEYTMGNDGKREGENSEGTLVVVPDDPGQRPAQREGEQTVKEAQLQEVVMGNDTEIEGKNREKAPIASVQLVVVESNQSSSEEETGEEEDCIVVEYVPPSAEGMQSIRKKQIFDLTRESMDRILGGKWLDADAVNLAQGILQESSSLTGFQPTTSVESSNVRPLEGQFVQILFDRDRSHWMCISSKGSPFVTVYDSLCNWRLSPCIMRQVRAILGGRKARLVYAKVHQQHNSSDCGVFAIAFATHVTLDQGPEGVTFDVGAMRRHLFQCLRDGKLTPFPSLENNSKKNCFVNDK